MILELTVKNFRSFKDEQTLLMTAEHNIGENALHKDHLYTNPNKEDSNITILKSCLIYGANASGKSNTLLAFKAVRDLVVSSYKFNKDDGLVQYYHPFKDTNTHSEKPIEFQIEFIAQDENRYRLELMYDKDGFIREELVYFPKKQRALLYSRDNNNNMKFGDHLKGSKKAGIPNRHNVLYISQNGNSSYTERQDEKLIAVYDYFSRNVNHLLRSPNELYQSLFDTLRIEHKKNSTFIKNFELLLRSSKTGIFSISFVENVSIAAEAIRFSHENTPDKPLFSLQEESGGTLKMLNISYKILKTLEVGGVLIIDEIDSSFHPMMSEFVFNLFHNMETNPHNAQLIVSTHDVSLLDFDNFRRDQIWFTEKTEDGFTELYSLDDFKKSEVRDSVPLGKWYMSGRFGALPLIKDVNLDFEGL